MKNHLKYSSNEVQTTPTEGPWRVVLYRNHLKEQRLQVLSDRVSSTCNPLLKEYEQLEIELFSNQDDANRLALVFQSLIGEELSSPVLRMVQKVLDIRRPAQQNDTSSCDCRVCTGVWAPSHGRLVQDDLIHHLVKSLHLKGEEWSGSISLIDRIFWFLEMVVQDLPASIQPATRINRNRISSYLAKIVPKRRRYWGMEFQVRIPTGSECKELANEFVRQCYAVN
jgi:hypothetical protein